MTVPKTGRTVVRALEELRVHPALDVIGSCAFLADLNEAARSPDQSSPEEPIFVTQAGLILAGFGRWRLALFRKVPIIECVEYCLTEEDALQFMLALQKRHNRWNPFIRIRLALNLERPLQQRALINMQMGGKHKGSATLPNAAQIDVREQIAAIAGVGARNVSKVKEIIEKGHPRILGELVNGSISINRAHLFCRLPSAKQLEALTEEYCDRVADDIEQGLFRRAGRYARRPPIAQRRITRVTTQEITFWAKDRRLRRQVTVRLRPKEFLAAWIQHIPERYEHAVRSFGIFAPRAIRESSAAVSTILGQSPRRRPRPLSWNMSIKRDFGWDPLLDRQGNRMTWARRIGPQKT